MKKNHYVAYFLILLISMCSGCANNFTVRAQYVNGIKQDSGVNDFRSIELEVRGRGTTPETLLMSFPRVLNQVVGIFMEDKDKPKK